MSKHRKWLFQELDRWIAGGAVSGDQAARIRALYPGSPAGVSWGTLALSGIGAVIVGLGVILLLAYNWEAMPRLVKLVLILGAAGGCHCAGIVFGMRAPARTNLTEVLCLLGTMFFGAGIWLVAQIYHIDEHFPNGFLIWGLGALAMAWALRSIPQAVVAAATLCACGVSEVAEFSNHADLSLVLIVAGIAPLAWLKRSAVLAAVTLAAVFLMFAFNAGHWGGFDAGFHTTLALAVLLVAAGRLVQGEPEMQRLAAVCRFFGAAVFLVCLYVLTFEEAARDILIQNPADGSSATGAGWYRWGVTVLALAFWVWLAVRGRNDSERRLPLDIWLIPLVLVFTASTAAMDRASVEALAAPVLNLVAFLLAALWMVQGCIRADPGRTIGGSLLLAAVVLARFFDLFDSLVARGVVFVVLGVALVAEGFVYRRLRKRTAEENART
ncbi:MAG: DUF2157 domain-containing protein [Opitutaceae bacterium]